MQQSEINRTKEILNYLDNKNVQYLDYSAYNEEEHDEKISKKYISNYLIYPWICENTPLLWVGDESPS